MDVDRDLGEASVGGGALMAWANPAGLGRRCAICGRIGGAGMARALRSIRAEAQDRGITLHWFAPASDDLSDGKAHGPCIMREKRRLHDAGKGE